MDSSREPGIRCSGVVVDRIEFRDQPAGSLPAGDLEFQIGVSRHFFDDPDSVDVTVHFRAAPETQEGGDLAEGFELEVSLTGRFEPLDGSTNMPLGDFARLNGPAILMPFVRELVANITARSRHGLVLMPPLNVALLVAGEMEAEQL